MMPILIVLSNAQQANNPFLSLFQSSDMIGCFDMFNMLSRLVSL